MHRSDHQKIKANRRGQDFNNIDGLTPFLEHRTSRFGCDLAMIKEKTVVHLVRKVFLRTKDKKFFEEYFKSIDGLTPFYTPQKTQKNSFSVIFMNYSKKSVD